MYLLQPFCITPRTEMITVIRLRAHQLLMAFKNAPNPEFLQNLSWRLFLRASVRGLEFVKNSSTFFQNCRFPNFDKYFDRFQAP